MTNILFKSDISDIVIIKTDKLNNYYVAENLVYSECGVNISQLFMRLADYNLGGFEELYGIPGSIGGSVFGNAGAFGRDISSLIYDLRLYDITTDEIIVKQIDDLEFSYRKSNISNRFVILSARLKLPFQPRESTLNNMKKYLPPWV